MEPCGNTTFGCCPDGFYAAEGPFKQGCMEYKTCEDTRYIDSVHKTRETRTEEDQTNRVVVFVDTFVLAFIPQNFYGPYCALYSNSKLLSTVCNYHFGSGTLPTIIHEQRMWC